MDEHRRVPNGHAPEEHSWALELLGPHVLGALDLEEEKAVEWHIAGCAACQEEERRLRKTHERLAGASIAASYVPPYLKARVLSTLPTRDGSETPIDVERRTRRFPSRVARMMMAAAMVILVVALPAVAGSSGLFDQTRTANLAPTALAQPGAGGGIEVKSSNPSNVEADLEVWGLSQPPKNGYYALWFSKDEGRVPAGTFRVDPDGRTTVSASVPQLGGDYQRVSVTLENASEEPHASSAKEVLSGTLQ